jgi:hypothetical protein
MLFYIPLLLYTDIQNNSQFHRHILHFEFCILDESDVPHNLDFSPILLKSQGNQEANRLHFVFHYQTYNYK